jgi:hypothetical protein
MATDRNELTDEFEIIRSGDYPEGYASENAERVDLPSIPDRPADSAAKAEWVDYAVALGADRTYIDGDTEHYDENDEAYHTDSGLTVSDLRELADRLGG